MNYLAHLYLSKDETEKVSIGNFIADAIKGSNSLHRFEEEIQRGIYLHRAIDDFTDNHALFKQGSKRLHTRYRKFSPVIVDIFYDHILASHWKEYSELPLQDFADKQYACILKYIDLLPERTRLWQAYMRRYNLLHDYSKAETITFVLQGMDNRTGGLSGMSSAMEEFTAHKSSYIEEFRVLFEDLQRFLIKEFDLKFRL
jgi:acyl carrier protein phosphodiesterase